MRDPGTLFKLDSNFLLNDAGEVYASRGGTVASNSISIRSASGRATLEGIGTRWTNATQFQVGPGELNVLNQAEATIGGLLKIDSLGVVNLDGGTLTVDSFDNQGTFNWISGTFTIGGGSGMQIGGSGGGSFAVAQGQSLNVTQDLSVGVGGTGTLDVLPGSRVDVGGSIDVATGGSIQLQQGTIDAQQWDLSGELHGSGQTSGDFQNDGLLAPRSSASISLTGDYTQTPAGVLELLLGDSGTLVIDGLATLDGTLSLELANGHVPGLGDQYRLLSANGISGAFSTLELPQLPGELDWSLDYGASAVTLSVVPEPSTCLLALTCIGAMAALGCRRSG